MEYHQIEEDKDYAVHPGTWSITSENHQYILKQASFVTDKILETFVHTKNIEDKIDCFFNKLHVYYSHGIEVPKRAALLYGPAGTGKSTSINKIAQRYGNDGKTAIVLWHTDKFEAHEIKGFVQSFKYVGVERLIMVIEDIGGVEIDQVRIKSDSSLLSLLDNQEKTFKIPVFILATTNYPENFLGNLTNRPNRFDDKVEMGYPDPEFRSALLKFYTKDLATQEELALMSSYQTAEFSAAHIREAVIRSQIYDRSISEVINEMYKEIDIFKKAFEKRSSMGINQ